MKYMHLFWISAIDESMDFGYCPTSGKMIKKRYDDESCTQDPLNTLVFYSSIGTCLLNARGRRSRSPRYVPTTYFLRPTIENYDVQNFSKLFFDRRCNWRSCTRCRIKKRKIIIIIIINVCVYWAITKVTPVCTPHYSNLSENIILRVRNHTHARTKINDFR